MSLKFARDRAQFARDRAGRSRPLETAQDRSGSLGIAAGIPVAPALLRRTPCRALTVPTTPASRSGLHLLGARGEFDPDVRHKERSDANGAELFGRSAEDE